MSNQLSAKDKSLINKWYQLACLNEMLAELEHHMTNGTVDKTPFKKIMTMDYLEMVGNQIGSCMSELVVVSQLIVRDGLNQYLDEQDNELIVALLSKQDNNEPIEQQEEVLTPNTRIH